MTETTDMTAPAEEEPQVRPTPHGLAVHLTAGLVRGTRGAPPILGIKSFGSVFEDHPVKRHRRATEYEFPASGGKLNHYVDLVLPRAGYGDDQYGFGVI